MKFYLTLTVATVLSVILIASFYSFAAQDIPAPEINRISASDAHQLVESGRAILVCSYPDDLCKDKLLEGAILLSQFESRVAALSKDQPIIFYCA